MAVNRLKVYRGKLDASIQHALSLLVVGKTPEDWEKMKSSPSTFVARHLVVPAGYFKVYFYRSMLDRVKSILRGSRCKRAVVQADLLARNGIDTPTVLAHGRYDAIEFMFTAAVPGIGVGDFLASYLQQVQQPVLLRWKRLLLAELGRRVAAMHTAGIVHGDLRPNNILLDYKETSPRFYFIDNERNSRHHKIPDKFLVKNLVQINMIQSIYLSRTDRLRFWRAYQNSFNGANDNLRDLVVVRTAQRMDGVGPERFVNRGLDPALVDPLFKKLEAI